MTIIDDTLSKARAYAQAGWQLVPLHSLRDGECTCRLKGKCKAAGKHPRITQWQNKATDDIEQIEAWLSQWPESNLGLRLGPGSGVVDIEFDDAEGEATANQLLSDIETPTYQSHRSTHRLFRFPTDIEITKAVEKVRGLEIRFGTDKRGAQSVLPPSRHNSGKQYTWLIPPEQCELAEFPDCIKELLRGDTTAVPGYELSFTMQSDAGLKSHPGEREGLRNETLCKLIGKWIAMHGVNAELLDEAISWGSRCSPPMDPQEVAQTVSNIAGKELAKGIPATASSAPTQTPGKLSLTPFNEIDPQEVEWLWQDRIALGKLTLVCGEPGLGKTFACCDIAARVSSGQAFPDGAMPPQGKVLILTCEDGPGDTLRPRLDKHDADVSQVFNIEGVERANGEVAFISLKEHLPTLEAYFEAEPTIKLLVVDPISAFLGDRCDSHNNTSVRAVLGPLCELAERHKVAVVGITHLSKSEAKAINRVIGSIAFVAAARAAWIVAQDDDDDDKRLFLQIKNNLANANGLSYSIVDGRCEWSAEPILIAADDIGGEQETPRAEAEKWLRETLADKPMPAKWMMNTARKDGISDRTLKRAKKALGVLSDKIGDAWTWRLPDEPKPELEDGVFIVK